MNKLISCLLAAIMILCNSSFVQSAEKKDVSDPVLREIISELSTTMPRFINKYGANVFVSDGQITRSDLIQALYEYNKNKSSNSSSTSTQTNIGFVSKDDFNLLKTKVSALEKKSLGTTKTTGSSVSSNMDIIQLMNDLEPNMPMLLDNSLQNSKVFRDLQKKVDSRSVTVGGSSVAQSSGISEAQLENIKNDISSLGQKYEALSAALTSNKDSKMSSAQVSSNITLLQKEIAGINVKLAGLQESVKNSSSAEQTKNNDIVSMKQEIVDLKAKVSSINTASLASGKGNDKASLAQQQEIAKLNEEITSLKTKISSMDTASLAAASKGGKSDSSQQKEIAKLNEEITTLKTKISSMDTALLAASKSDKSDSSQQKEIAKLNDEITSLKTKISSMDTASLAATKGSKSDSTQQKEIAKLNDEITNLKIKIAGIDAATSVSSKNSKANLSQQEIAKLSEELDSLKKTVNQTQKSYVDVAKRVNSLEDRPVVTASSSSSASSSQIGYLESKINSIKKSVENVPTNEYVQTQISKSNSKTTTDIKKIESRLNELEKNKASYKGSSDSGSSDSGSSSTGTITKISLGLTLVAALFIAR